VTRNSTTLRGLAILVIVFHNFLHVVPPSPGENEFSFDAARFPALTESLRADPAAAPRLLTSYFGHYGVQLFILLSAYGLTKKFRRGVPGYRPFIWSRFEKIYPAFLLAIALYVLRYGFSLGWSGPLSVLRAQWYPLLLKVTLVSNIVPGQALQPVGPWWFLPFIFQCYFLFPLLFAATARWGLGVLIAISLGGLAAVAFWPFRVDVMATVVGHLPELCFGLWLGSQTGWRVPGWMIWAAVPLFALGNVYQAFWYIAPLSALVVMLAAWQTLEPWIGGRLLARGLAFIGALSLPLFLVHGFLRQPFLAWAGAVDSEAVVLAIALLFALVSIGVAMVVHVIEQRLRRAVREWRDRRVQIAVAS
jgi:peptidoglycan/LPS O-acetylase OafA/YrhL